MSTCSVALVAPISETLTLSPAAFLGLAGDWAEAVADFTEAAPVGILVSSLIAFGSAIGHGPHVRVGATVHRVNENAVLVGRTASGRKGEAMNAGLLPLRAADPRWSERVCRGFGSGEAVIAAVAPRPEDDSLEEPVDPRLLVHEDELSGPLAIASRQGSTLSNILRTAWDGGRLESRTRAFGALVAPDPHVSVLAAITPEELVHRVSATDIANGFLNRFLMVKVERNQLLPEGRAIPGKLTKRYAAWFASSIEVGGQQREMRRDSDAADVWRHAYEHELSVDRFGLAGAACSRAEAHTLRLSMLYALLDRRRSNGFVIRADHVEAALALWRYCEQSAHLLFGDRTGTPYVEAILTALRASPKGLTRTEIRDQFGRHNTAEVERALRDLERSGSVASRKEATGGRSATRYMASDVRNDRSDECDRSPTRRTPE
jgi:Protein of unknown function (DUF3987)